MVKIFWLALTSSPLSLIRLTIFSLTQLDHFILSFGDILPCDRPMGYELKEDEGG